MQVLYHLLFFIFEFENKEEDY